MKRMQGLAVMWAMGTGLILGTVGCGGSSPQAGTTTEPPAKKNTDSSELSSPEKTLAAIKSADAKREYEKFCQHFTNDAQQVFAGGLYVSCKNLKTILDEPDSQDEQDRALVQAIDALLKKHGLQKDLEAIVKDAAPPEQVVQTKGEQPGSQFTIQQKILKAVGEQIKDPSGFVADGIKTIQENGRNSDARLFEDNARLENIKIDNDRAEAELVFSREKREFRRPVGFQNVSGEWKFSTVPDVLYK